MTFNPGLPTYEHTVRWAPSPLAGALAGLLASIPMALVMMALNRRLSRGRVEPEPPKQITQEMAERTDTEETIPAGRKWGLTTWLGHLGYGAAAASIYPATAYRLPLPTAVRGIVFAILVWAGSYMGWLPAFNILPPANRQPARRNAVTILPHFVWGSLTALLVKAFFDQ